MKKYILPVLICVLVSLSCLSALFGFWYSLAIGLIAGLYFAEVFA